MISEFNALKAWMRDFGVIVAADFEQSAQKIV